jgi:inactivated superfamily I helicase
VRLVKIMPIRLYCKNESGAETLVGPITEAQRATLIDLLEEEDEEDQDYFIDADVLAFMEEEGADAALVAMLRPLVGEEEGAGVEVEWREEP